MTEPVAGWPHECVVARCRVSERQARVGSAPAAGGPGRAPDQIQRHDEQPLSYTQAPRRCGELPRISLPGEDRQAPALPGGLSFTSHPVAILRRPTHGTGVKSVWCSLVDGHGGGMRKGVYAPVVR